MSPTGLFSGRTVVVTGGAASLGREIARLLATDGATVVVADRDMKAARRACADIALAGGTAVAEQVDVTDAAQVARLVSDVVSRYGAIDGLVNNAGMLGPIKPLADTNDEEVDRVLALNVRAVFTCTREVIARMKSGAAVVSIASTAGKEGPPGLSPYSASKGALIACTKSWAKELVGRGIRVNCVAPTLIGDTGMHNEMPQTFTSDSVSRIPMGRAATAAEVANVVLFLLSDKSSFVTGACYDVSGGRASY